MRIGIYYQLANQDQPTGIGLHIRELVNALARIDPVNEYLLYHRSDVLASPEQLVHAPASPNFRPRPVRFPAGWHLDRPRLWWQTYLPLVLRRDRLDVFHGPNHFLPALTGLPKVLTIHDLAYFRMDHLHGDGRDSLLREWTKRSLEQANIVIALSENTRRDVLELGVDPDAIRVIYGGGCVVPDDQIAYNRVDELRARFGLPDHYILFVGTLQPRKNVPFLINAFARLKKTGQFPHKLVLAGQRGPAAADIETLIRSLEITQDVIVTGYVEDWQLPLLYKLADVFVLPTLYEGFTLVTLEAMAYGTAVIATDTSSIKEGVGDAALLVPVGDVDGLVQALRCTLTDDRMRRKLIDAGREQARRFTWERCAQVTLGVYTDVSARARQCSAS